MTAYAAPRHVATGADTLTVDDFETASVRSAAPSYISEAPSYHSTVPNNTESVPPYAPRSSSDARPSSDSDVRNEESASEAAPSQAQRTERQTGLPPVPRGPLPIPSLSAFAIPTWSAFTANPTTRHYQSVAQRRVAAANDRVGAVRRQMLDRVLEEEDERIREFRPLEDPYLVGEEAARRARAKRVARERGDEVLIGENRRWDWYMSQMGDMDERQRSWARFRRQMEVDERKSFVRRISGRLAF